MIIGISLCKHLDPLRFKRTVTRTEAGLTRSEQDPGISALAVFLSSAGLAGAQPESGDSITNSHQFLLWVCQQLQLETVEFVIFLFIGKETLKVLQYRKQVIQQLKHVTRGSGKAGKDERAERAGESES